MSTAVLEQEVSKVLEFAESAPREDRYIEQIEIGQFTRQGDLYLIRIAVPHAAWKPTTNRQLAIGTTNGSRHTVADSVTVLANPNNGRVERKGNGVFQCFGPQIVSETRFRVAHPEHGDHSLPPGCYQVGFQVDARSMQAVRD